MRTCLFLVLLVQFGQYDPTWRTFDPQADLRERKSIVMHPLTLQVERLASKERLSRRFWESLSVVRVALCLDPRVKPSLCIVRCV